MCEKISKFLINKKITGIVPILRGGAIPATIISNMLNVPIKNNVEKNTNILIKDIVNFG